MSKKSMHFTHDAFIPLYFTNTSIMNPALTWQKINKRNSHYQKLVLTTLKQRTSAWYWLLVGHCPWSIGSIHLQEFPSNFKQGTCLHQLQFSLLCSSQVISCQVEGHVDGLLKILKPWIHRLEVFISIATIPSIRNSMFPCNPFRSNCLTATTLITTNNNRGIRCCSYTWFFLWEKSNQKY